MADHGTSRLHIFDIHIYKNKLLVLFLWRTLTNIPFFFPHTLNSSSSTLLSVDDLASYFSKKIEETFHELTPTCICTQPAFSPLSMKVLCSTLHHLSVNQGLRSNKSLSSPSSSFSSVMDCSHECINVLLFLLSCQN